MEKRRIMFKKFEKLYFLYPYFLFGLIILLFYWPLRRAGFIVDDPQYIWFSAKNPILKILFDPMTPHVFKSGQLYALARSHIQDRFLFIQRRPAGL